MNEKEDKETTELEIYEAFQWCSVFRNCGKDFWKEHLWQAHTFENII